MREHPDLEQLKRQAKELLRGFAAGDAKAVAEVNAHYRAADASKFALHDAQLVIARSYGFDSWPKLKAYVDGVTVRRLAEAVRADDLSQVRAMLRARPELADMAMSYGDEHRPIHFAVMKRSPEMVRLLMRHGANARQGIHPHRDATTAWTIAKEREYAEIVAIIEEEEQKRGEAKHRRAEAEAFGDENGAGGGGGGRHRVAARAARRRHPREPGPVEWRRAAHGRGAAQPAGDPGAAAGLRLRPGRTRLRRRRRLGRVLAGISAVVLRGARQARDGGDCCCSAERIRTCTWIPAARRSTAPTATSNGRWWNCCGVMAAW